MPNMYYPVDKNGNKSTTPAAMPDPILSAAGQLANYYAQQKAIEAAQAEKQAEYAQNEKDRQERINKDISIRTDMTSDESRHVPPLDLTGLIGNNKTMRASMGGSNS